MRSLGNFSGDWKSVKKSAKWLHMKYLLTLLYLQTSQVSSDANLFIFFFFANSDTSKSLYQAIYTSHHITFQILPRTSLLE